MMEHDQNVALTPFASFKSINGKVLDFSDLATPSEKYVNLDF